MSKDTVRAREQARAQLDGIVELVKALEGGGEVDEQMTREEVEETIQEAPLSVEVRTDWHAVGAEDDKPTEYNILLCTGGPAVRIIGDLDDYSQPITARIEYQDWFTPWEAYRDTSHDEEQAMITYARQFYYGEG